jgi:hypothetical protein
MWRTGQASESMNQKTRNIFLSPEGIFRSQPILLRAAWLFRQATCSGFRQTFPTREAILWKLRSESSMNCLSLATSILSLAAVSLVGSFFKNHRSVSSERRGQRLLAITGEIVDSRSLAIFFSGSSKLLNLIVSALCT